ncbi:MAG: ATP-binding cassette domain-containing protein [Phycisphaerales bacterium]|nr:MAG: ATP-binding cassette domain-containing protein [Phycisphaerales bacterium]
MDEAFDPMEPPILDIRQVSYKIDDRLILNRICWRLSKGEHWVILGPNGAGKTTLLKIACGYLWPNDGGEIHRNGQALVDLRQLRESIGWVTTSLIADIPPTEIVTRSVVSGKFAQLGFREYTGQKLEDADVAQAHQYLSEMGCAHLAGQKFGTLSQGERQRVLISRARMARPLLLILDEPCAGLDPGGRELLLESIANLARNQQTMGMVLVTQHIEEIMPVFENVLVLSDGRIIEKGPTERVISPQLIGRLYGVSARISRSADRYWMIRD